MVAAVGGDQNGGFTMQLNAYNPAGPTTSWMQYVFLVSDNTIKAQVQYWDMAAFAQLLSLQKQVLSLSSNTIPAGYVLEIGLRDEDGNISAAEFKVTDENGNTTIREIKISYTGYRFPIVAFQVNIGGPDNSSHSRFSSGSGTITYVSNGQLCVEGGLPDLCSKSSGSNTPTAETSTASYGAIGPPCCASQLAQSLSTRPQTQARAPGFLQGAVTG
jgi:hypothetical protein